MKISVTNHAVDAFLKRGRHIINKVAIDAWNEGELLDDDEMERIFEKGIEKDKYWKRDYRKHLGLIWVFGHKSRKTILVTVLPC